MSQTRTYTIRCPQCQEAFDVDLYESINVVDTPKLKNELMANQLNSVSCAQCGFSYRVDKPLLYHDPAQNAMVYWLPDAELTLSGNSETQFQQAVKELNRILPQGVEAPRMHLVLNRTELVERIFLIEAGLDERIIEYIKYLIYTRNLKQLDPTEKALLFDAEDSNDTKLVFVVQDVSTRKLEGMLEYEREAYDALSEMFDQDDRTANLYELFPGPYVSARSILLDEASDPSLPQRNANPPGGRQQN